ncbi:MAG TPA: cation:proton antiporter, partial [Solirubrobacterales bacterium]|nr:cation:proton antiporter [Solirubrobacterales bacterium]
MVADPILFRDLAYVFVAAVLGGGLAWLARQPLILGYVAGGLLVSPLTPGPAVSDVHTFELFAEIGVVLLMFSLGIEFSLKDLMRVKWVAILGGPLGIVLSIAAGIVTGAALGWSLLEGAVVGMVVSVASTMVLARLLLDRGELRSRHGRVMIGITLVEDLAVVVLMVLIPALGGPHGDP